MPNTLQNISNNVQPQQFIIKPPVTNQAPAQPENKPPQPDKNNNYFSSGTIIGSLSGLAVLGGSVWALTSGKFKSKVRPLSAKEINDNIIATSEQIKLLKKLIKKEYLIKKQAIIDRLNDIEEPDYAIPFTTTKELNEETKIFQEKYEKVYQTCDPIIKENKQIIKEKFQTLLKNPEFNELRKLRKALINIVATSNSEDEVKIANDKILMVNDLLINRAYPEKAAKFTPLYNLEDKQVYELVKENFETYEQFIEKYDTLNGKESDFDLLLIEDRFLNNKRLRFKDIFPKEADCIITNLKTIENAKHDVILRKNLYKTYISRLTELAQKYQETQTVKELHAHTQRLNMLREKLKNAA